MDAAMAIAASGMAAASASLTASASNIATMQTAGPAPTSGGVTTALSSVLPSSPLAYDPSAPFANLQGMVAAPNVDPVAEAVNQMTASEAFRANLAVFETASKNFRTLLDALA